MAKQNNRFWVGGSQSHLTELHREMTLRLRPLEVQLSAEKDKAARAELKRQIKEIKAGYVQKEREANYALFNQR